VVVLSDPAPMPMLAEALVRVRGELAAAGLQADLRERKLSDPSEYKPDPGVYGVLAFEQLGPVILIRAFGPAARTPITESVDTQSSAVNAEVLAVRAVETLRAAMVQQPGHDASDVPDAVRNFTRSAQTAETRPEPDKPPEPPPEPVKPPPRPPAPKPKRVRPPSSPDVERRVIGWLGAGLSLEPNASARSSGQLGVLAGPRWGFVAASFETSLTPLTLREPAGSASVTERAVTLAFGGRLKIASRLELFTRLAGGYAWYDVAGKAQDGYLGRHLRPRSPFAGLSVSTAYWLNDTFALALDAGTRLALDAPRVRIAGSDVVALDRPSFDASLTLLLHVL
jgi:hypothetical protein